MRAPRRSRAKRYSGSLSPAFVGFVVILLGFATGFFLRLRHANSPQVSASHSGSTNSPAATALPTRRVYPLSVIHGGAYSPSELRRARNNDAVVAAHYADFGLSPKFQRLQHDAMMYVSYRRGNQVFWSRTQHRIPAGETVISDGSCLARARCGNRLSAKPQGPVAPKEPSDEVLNTPEVPEEPVTYKLADLPLPGGRPFNLALPAFFEEGTPTGSTPVLVPASSPAVTLQGASPAYFASGPGSGFGGVGARNASPGSSTSTPGSTTSLPTTTTGGSSSPTSDNYPPPPTGSIPSDTSTELVPEPGSLSYALISIVGALVFLVARLIRRTS